MGDETKSNNVGCSSEHVAMIAHTGVVVVAEPKRSGLSTKRSAARYGVGLSRIRYRMHGRAARDVGAGAHRVG